MDNPAGIGILSGLAKLAIALLVAGIVIGAVIVGVLWLIFGA